MENDNQKITMDLIDRLVDWESSLTSRDEFINLLESGKKLKIKYGVDLTAPTLHLGHAVNLQVMRILQGMGHEVQFLSGTFTTRIGDPTGKNKTRDTISLNHILENKKLFLDQVGMVLDTDKDVFSEHDNSDWFLDMSLIDFFGLLKEVTHAQLIHRDMFQSRIKNGEPIAMTEMMYPILQGWDSVKLKSDLTIVGSDQLFNEKMGRLFQSRFDQNPQAIITTRITPGLDGGPKQSKSIGNYVGLAHSPFEKFSRTMLLSDELIPLWTEVYTSASQEELDKCVKEWKNDPLKWKERLAWLIVERFHGNEEADNAKNRFYNERLGDSDSEDMKEYNVSGKPLMLTIADIFEQSNSWARQMINSGAVQINNEKIEDINYLLSIGDSVRVGKKKAGRVFKVL